MFYKSALLAIGLMLVGSDYTNASEIPTVESNPVSNPDLLEIENVDAVNRTSIEPSALIANSSQPAATDLSLEVTPVKPRSNPIGSPTRSNSTPTPIDNSNQIRNPQLDRANIWGMAYVSPLSDVLRINDSVVKPNGTKIGQTPTETESSRSTEPKKWSVGVHAQASTTGFIGVDAGYKFSPNLHTRLGINTVGFGYNYSSQGIDYNASLSPTNVHLLGDYFPFGGGLRLTGGLIFQNNRFSGSAKSNASNQININGTNYNASQIGTVETSGSFSNSVAPYLGVGFGTPINEGFGFNVDLGVMFAGSPTVSLSANNISPLVPAAIQNQLRSDLAAQQQKTNADISSFRLYPVLSIGFSYAF
ncbi:hypothetical protein [Chamaesiphon polymorphus]|uniref:Outer membrane protein beta-barrel domain-containing protein n=1 Tax=Chamaesiphon polymorphus CCALA 037 TaxID=2107692 RepID=A0A2T1G894_9CYAN|nr:hypothetical protein [Chamaesiphon polymorphus]PSB53472.1 hypothetical protein C7B77_19520 [Chamaesiphon polymorphus CCALA 037]